MTAENPKAIYACINLGEAYAPGEIAGRAICIDWDIGNLLKKLKLFLTGTSLLFLTGTKWR